MGNETNSANPILSLDLILFESTPGIRFVLLVNNPEFTVVAATRDACDYLHTSRSQIVGTPISQVFRSPSLDQDISSMNDLALLLENVLKFKKRQQGGVKQYSRDEEDNSFTKKNFLHTADPVMDKSGELTHIILAIEVIAEKANAGEMDGTLVKDEKILAVRKTAAGEDGFRVAMDQTHLIIFMADTHGTVIFCNKYWEEYTGLHGWSTGWKETVHPDDHEHLKKTIYRSIKTGESYTVEARIRNKQGDYHYFLFTGSPRYDDQGTIVGSIATGIDINDRKQEEEALKKSELNLRNIIIQSPVAMCILRGASHIVEIANDCMYQLLGREKDQILNRSIFDSMPEVKNQGYEERLEQVLITGAHINANGIPVKLPRKDGIETVYLNILYQPYCEADGTISGIMVVAVDVTEQVLSRMKVEESNKEFKFVTDFMPQMIWVTRSDGYHYYYNKQWYDYTGLTYGETEGEGWNHVFHPDDRELAWKHWHHSLQTGEPYEIEYRCRRYDGQYRWVLGRALPLKDNTGRILKWFGTCTDIDDQKKEAQLLEEKVKERTRELESQKKELERSNVHLEDFAYAASHDLKEPIRKIRAFSDRLKDKLKNKLSDDDQYYFDRMQNATDRMQMLIEDLLEYSHVSRVSQNLDEIDLNKKVARVLDDLELEITQQDARILVEELPVIKGHRRQIQQLFQNLVTNAIKFRKPGHSPEVRISSSLVNGKNITSLQLDENAKEKVYNVLQVTDNGIGFEQEYAEKIFKMFHRLHAKEDYEGTGIGLAIVRKVVENHKGFIHAESKLGEGATFRVYLPVEL